MNCKCFWIEDGRCWKDMSGPQEVCPQHAYRINPETGEKLPPEGERNAYKWHVNDFQTQYLAG